MVAERLLDLDYGFFEERFEKSVEDVKFMREALMNGQVFAATSYVVCGAWWVYWYFLIGLGCSNYV